VTKQERQEQARIFDQQERAIEATNRLAAATERAADAAEVSAGYRFSPIDKLPIPSVAQP
jgi:hypothetical protein